MYNLVLAIFRTINELLSAGIAIFAFSLLIYAFSFNLRDRVARSFAIILLCVVIVSVGDALGSVSASLEQIEFWLRFQWLGIVLLPPAYLHLSDALLATTGRPSRGRRRLVVRLSYLISLGFLLALFFSNLVGPLVQDGQSVAHLERTWLTWVFIAYYVVLMGLSWFNFWRAYQRTLASASRRRMSYLLAGAIAPALGSFPFLLFGSAVAERLPLVFWLLVMISNFFVIVLLVLMAYAVAFFGVAWPDRVVKRRLFKWLMRGPVTASAALAITTLVRRSSGLFGVDPSILVPVSMAGSILLIEHLFTLVAPAWENWLFRGGDQADLEILETLEERLLTRSDMRQFLEAVLAAVCDRLQAPSAFVATLGPQGLEMLVHVGGENPFTSADLSNSLLQFAASDLDFGEELYTWGGYWLVPLFDPDLTEEEVAQLIGLLGVERDPSETLDEEQAQALSILAERACLAMRDRRRQQQVFTSLEALTPQIDLIQRLRAAARYDGAVVLTSPDQGLHTQKISQWVKEALTHYWGGPKLTSSPLMKFLVVQQNMQEHEDNPTNALRAILKQAIEYVRPAGERRFTAEWVLYNILEMKFLEGRKVREIALRLAMSEADLYRKQRIAIEAVAKAILEMEKQAQEQQSDAVDSARFHT